jgi:hypothetical protein
LLLLLLLQVLLLLQQQQQQHMAVGLLQQLQSPLAQQQHQHQRQQQLLPDQAVLLSPAVAGSCWLWQKHLHYLQLQLGLLYQRAPAGSCAAGLRKTAPADTAAQLLLGTAQALQQQELDDDLPRLLQHC